MGEGGWERLWATRGVARWLVTTALPVVLRRGKGNCNGKNGVRSGFFRRGEGDGKGKDGL